MELEQIYLNLNESRLRLDETTNNYKTLRMPYANVAHLRMAVVQLTTFGNTFESLNETSGYWFGLAGISSCIAYQTH